MSSTALDPSIVPLADQVPFGDLTNATLAEIRATPLMLPGELSDAVERVDHVVSEAPRVVVRVHTPKAAASGPRPCVYSIHGGGYVIGSYEMDDLKFDQLCPALAARLMTGRTPGMPRHTAQTRVFGSAAK